MKTGVIVYVVGKESLDDTIDFEEAGKRLSIKADRVRGSFVYTRQLRCYGCLVAACCKGDEADSLHDR